MNKRQIKKQMLKIGEQGLESAMSGGISSLLSGGAFRYGKKAARLLKKNFTVTNGIAIVSAIAVATLVKKALSERPTSI